MGRCYSYNKGAKRKYYDKKEAQGVCNKMTKKYGQEFVVYECKECGAYHIGRTDGIRKKEILEGHRHE